MVIKEKKRKKKTLLPDACLSLSLQILDKHLVLPASESDAGTVQAAAPGSQKRERRVGLALKRKKEITSTVCNLRRLGVSILHTGCGWRGETDVVLQGMRRNVFFPNGYRVNANIFSLGFAFPSFSHWHPAEFLLLYFIRHFILLKLFSPFTLSS